MSYANIISKLFSGLLFDIYDLSILFFKDKVETKKACLSSYVFHVLFRVLFSLHFAV